MAHPARLATVVVLLGAALLAGCKGRTTVAPGRTVTVTPSSSQVSSTSSSAPSLSATTSPTATPTALHVPAPAKLARPEPLSKLPGRCDDLLPAERVSRAAGGFGFDGENQFVVGLPDKQTGRVGYLDCRYGVDSGAPQLEIYVGLYRTAARAQARIAPTVADFGDHGAGSAAATVSGFPATLLTGGTDTGYGPTIAVAYGQRTVAVTVGDAVFPTPSVTAALKSLTALAASRTS